ncbi:MAG: N-acetylglucosamine-6-phosphate deacetylase [Anaerolineaceae bacterium]|nr:MAG: N-acetylglucosamine-6-phosphate deacetylase [Anaerolineaceae bacterium]
MIIKNALVYKEDEGFIKEDIYIRDDKIVEDSQIGDQDQVLDGEGLYAIPGLTDIHFHGCVGYDFVDGTHQALENIALYQASNGVTTICPTGMTLPEEELESLYRNASTYESKVGAILCGVHMEGPFISSGKKGAQNEKYIHKPDLNFYYKLQKASGNLIKILTIAPEEEGALEIISQLKDEVVISIAHTEADYDTTMEAFRRGASHVTHLYNAMPPFTHRAPGVIGAAFDTPGIYVELITDGVHIHPSAVRVAFELFGEDRIILISDSMMAAGMPDGDYTLGGQSVKVTGNKAVLSDGTLAGSVTNLMECMKNCVLMMGIPLEQAVKCATVNPAKSIGIYDSYGSITPGKIANIVLLDQDLNIKSVILKGRKLVPGTKQRQVASHHALC